MSPIALQIMKAEVKKYIDEADEKTVKMVHAMLEAVEEQEDEDSIFIKTLERRSKEYENGEPVTMTLEELEEGAKNYRKAKKERNK